MAPWLKGILLIAVIAALVYAVTYRTEERPRMWNSSHTDDGLIPPADQIRLSTTAQSTAEADEVMGTNGTKAIVALESLPNLVETKGISHAIGSALRPAMYLRFTRRPLRDVVEAYAAMWNHHSGPYEVLALGTQGWRHVLQCRAKEVEKVACSIDVVTNIQLEYDQQQALHKLNRGCAELARRLDAKTEGKIDESTITRTTDSLRALRKEVDTSIDIKIVASNHPFQAREVHRIARSLGFVRSDFGSYAWYNESDFGYDILITIRPGDEPFQFNFTDPYTTYTVLTFGFDLDQVPLPELVAQRMWTAVATFKNQLGGRIEDMNSQEIDQAWLRSRVHSAVQKLEGTGLLVQAKAVGQ